MPRFDGKRILFFQQRRWAMNIGHPLAKRFQPDTATKTTDKFIRGTRVTCSMRKWVGPCDRGDEAIAYALRRALAATETRACIVPAVGISALLPGCRGEAGAVATLPRLRSKP